ncbi:MAG: fumarate hydratase [Sphaerochaetaceae bacterium]|nr:fumarate hydratase [Sphaerochaetaceae bacterium]
MSISVNDIRKAASQALVIGSSTFRPDQIRAYERAIEKETDEKSRWVLEKTLENAAISEKDVSPLCDDTGIPHPFLEIGKDARYEGSVYDLLKAVEEGVADGLRELPGRPMAVKGEGLERMAQIHGLYEDSGKLLAAPVNIRKIDGSEIRVTVLMQGGGPEIRSKTYHVFHKHKEMQLIDTAVEWANEMVAKLGCTPCVPAIGIGRTHYEASSMMIEAQKEGNFDIQSDIENYITDKINKSDVGPLGLGGDVTALGTFLKIGEARGSGVRILCVRLSCCFEPRKHTVVLR